MAIEFESRVKTQTLSLIDGCIQALDGLLFHHSERKWMEVFGRRQ